MYIYTVAKSPSMHAAGEGGINLDNDWHYSILIKCYRLAKVSIPMIAPGYAVRIRFRKQGSSQEGSRRTESDIYMYTVSVNFESYSRSRRKRIA